MMELNRAYSHSNTIIKCTQAVQIWATVTTGALLKSRIRESMYLVKQIGENAKTHALKLQVK